MTQDGVPDRSLPSAHSPGYDDAISKGFLFEFTKTQTYWSTISTMQSYVTGILIPYFHEEQHKLQLPKSQPCIWQIDVWSVHTSQEFRSWMWDMYPWIILDYVPGGCTGLFQPCNVGMCQRHFYCQHVTGRLRDVGYHSIKPFTLILPSLMLRCHVILSHVL